MGVQVDLAAEAATSPMVMEVEVVSVGAGERVLGEASSGEAQSTHDEASLTVLPCGDEGTPSATSTSAGEQTSSRI